MRMAKSKIEWTDEVWNPITGCTKVSQGCKHCYAETMAKRLKAMGRPEYQDVIGVDGRWNGTIQLVKERLEDPLRWKKPRRVFVNSMSDLFHEDIGFEIWKIFDIMAQTPQHTYMILTKRPKNMFSFCQEYDPHDLAPYPLPNVWLGVSVEDQKTADERIPLLLQTPAAKRIVSVEPMLGALYVNTYLRNYTYNDRYDDFDIGEKQIDWVIAGCESGAHRRPCNPDWLRSLRDQCNDACVPFFLKQMDIDGKVVKMPALDGRVWDERPEV